MAFKSLFQKYRRLVIFDTETTGLDYKKDQIIEVSDGYARNFLFPQKKAIPADAQATNNLKGKAESAKFHIEEERAAARALAERLGQSEVVIHAECGKDGRLYGAVTSKDISAALKSQFNILVDKRKILLFSHIRHGRCALRCRQSHNTAISIGSKGKLQINLSTYSAIALYLNVKIINILLIEVNMRSL